MKKIIATILGILTIGSAHALEPLELPGSNWAVLVFPSGIAGAEKDNVLLQGKLEQGAIWKRFGQNKEWALNTYMSLAYSADSQGLEYNNKVVPAVGVKIQRNFLNGVVDIGVQAVYENRWKSSINQTGTGVQAYISVWNGWNLKK